MFRRLRSHTAPCRAETTSRSCTRAHAGTRGRRPDLPSNPDVVVIGAGAAGIAAARRLIEAGRSVVLLEAGDRIGGRAGTDTPTFGTPHDLGCAWLQGPADLPHIAYAPCIGFSLLDHRNPRSVLFVDDRRATAAERRGYAATADRIMGAIAGAGDVAVAECVATDLPFAGTVLAWLGALDHAVDYTELSTADVNALGPREANYLVREGLGRLMMRFGARLPVRLLTSATCMRWGGTPDVRIETASAGALRARACIVTASTGVLMAGGLRFVPGLPDWKAGAIADLPMGLLAKVTLQFDGQRFGLRRNEWLSCDLPANTAGEACFFLSFPHGSNLMVGFVGGRFGWALSAAGAEAAIDHALDVLSRCLGARVRCSPVRSARACSSPARQRTTAASPSSPVHTAVARPLPPQRLRPWPGSTSMPEHTAGDQAPGRRSIWRVNGGSASRICRP